MDEILKDLSVRLMRIVLEQYLEIKYSGMVVSLELLDLLIQVVELLP